MEKALALDIVKYGFESCHDYLGINSKFPFSCLLIQKKVIFLNSVLIMVNSKAVFRRLWINERSKDVKIKEKV